MAGNTAFALKLGAKLARGAQLDVISKQLFIGQVGSALDDDMARLQQQPGDDAVVAAATERGGKRRNGERDHPADHCPAKARTEAVHGVRLPEANSDEGPGVRNAAISPASRAIIVSPAATSAST